jgi:hypothetical protein
MRKQIKHETCTVGGWLWLATARLIGQARQGREIKHALEVPPKTVEIEKSNKTKQTIPNEAYSTWVAKDQQLLAFLLNSITKEVLPAVSTLGTSREV